MVVEIASRLRPGFAFNVCAALSFLHLLDNAAMADSRPSSPPAVVAATQGRPEVVYDWKAHKCSQFTYPDTAARAFRDADGQVHLLAPNDPNWSMVGPSLDKVQPVCRSLAHGGDNPDPGKFDDKPWIEATYTLDGRTVFALASNEWSANRHPGNAAAAAIDCRDPHNQACYFYGITEFISHDMGYSFAYPPLRHLVAAVPSPYHPDAERRSSTGIATASNIIARNGAYYAFVGVRGVPPQKSGSCLIRTGNLADPGAWRGWDGHGFDVQFANPYTETSGDSGRHICAPVYPYEVRSINWLPAQKTYVGVFREWGDSQGKQVPGFFYATTPDLIAWSGMRLIMKVPTEEECGDVDVYPSLLDPTSGGRNFETLGSRPYLYYVRFNRTRCGGTLDRDLVRVALKIGNAAATMAPAKKRP